MHGSNLNLFARGSSPSFPSGKTECSPRFYLQEVPKSIVFPFAKDENDELQETFSSPHGAHEVKAGTARSVASGQAPSRGSIDATFDRRTEDAPRPRMSSTLALLGMRSSAPLALAEESNVIDLGETEASVETAEKAVGWGTVLLRLLDVGLFLGEEVKDRRIIAFYVLFAFDSLFRANVNINLSGFQSIHGGNTAAHRGARHGCRASDSSAQ